MPMHRGDDVKDYGSHSQSSYFFPSNVGKVKQKMPLVWITTRTNLYSFYSSNLTMVRENLCTFGPEHVLYLQPSNKNLLSKTIKCIWGPGTCLKLIINILWVFITFFFAYMFRGQMHTGFSMDEMQFYWKSKNQKCCQ